MRPKDEFRALPRTLLRPGQSTSKTNAFRNAAFDSAELGQARVRPRGQVVGFGASPQSLSDRPGRRRRGADSGRPGRGQTNNR